MNAQNEFACSCVVTVDRCLPADRKQEESQKLPPRLVTRNFAPRKNNVQTTSCKRSDARTMFALSCHQARATIPHRSNPSRRTRSIALNDQKPAKSVHIVRVRHAAALQPSDVQNAASKLKHARLCRHRNARCDGSKSGGQWFMAFGYQQNYQQPPCPVSR